jgi:hypothetical protein
MDSPARVSAHAGCRSRGRPRGYRRNVNTSAARCGARNGNLQPGMFADAVALAWLARFLEGEGCFSLMARRYPRVVATSPDLDVLVKLQTLARVGVVRSRARTGLGIERRWYCIVSRTREAIALMHGIRPVMGDRRGRMIDTVLERTLRLQSIGSGELSTSASLTCDSPPSVDFT